MNFSAFNSHVSSPARYVARRNNLFIRINNLSDLFAAYGVDCVRHAIRNASQYRLAFLGVSVKDILFVGEYIVVDLSKIQISDSVSDDLFLERVKARLSRLPIEFEQGSSFLNVFATFGRVRQSVSRNTSHALQTAEVDREEMQRKKIAYRNDMATATNFLKHVRSGLIVLAFQPMVIANSIRKEIYSECLLRRPLEGNGLASCQTEIDVLERLGLIDRLDRSVLWTVIETLEENPLMHLGCNVSALSLRQDCWWRLLQNYLTENPNVAERLTLQITGTNAISNPDEAANLLRAMSVIGCRIVIDDMQVSPDFLVKASPDMVKIECAFMTDSPSQVPLSSPIHHLSFLCSDLNLWMAATRVTSQDELNAALNAGARCAQGYFIERPAILPYWLTAPISVRDSFSPEHRCLSTNNIFPRAHSAQHLHPRRRPAGTERLQARLPNSDGSK